MNLILPVDFIDVSAMAAALVMKHSVRFGDDKRRQAFHGSPHHDTESILLRGPMGEISRETWFDDVPHCDSEALEAWPTARAVIAKIAESHRLRSGLEPIFGKIMVVSLKAGGWVDWHVDQGFYAQVHDRFHLCLIPSAGGLMFSGGMSAALPQGQLTYFNNHVLHSAINVGTNPRVHLICDIRRPESIN